MRCERNRIACGNRVPFAVIVTGRHFKRIFPRPEIRVISDAIAARPAPLTVLGAGAVQPILKLHFLWSHKTIDREVNLQYARTTGGQVRMGFYCEATFQSVVEEHFAVRYDLLNHKGWCDFV